MDLNQIEIFFFHLTELSRNPSRNEEIDEEAEKPFSNNNNGDDVTCSSQYVETLSCGSKKEFRLVRLHNNSDADEDEDVTKTLGIFIARVRESQPGESGVTCAAYYIAHIMQDGLVWK